MRAAAATFRSGRYLTVDGGPPIDPWSPIAGYYETGDGRWMQLHTNFPHHRDGVLRVLGCVEDRRAVAAALAGWQGQELEDTLAAANMCAGLVRSSEEWATHGQGRAVAALPLMEIIRIGEAPPRPLAAASAHPLSGVRVLDLSRIIAGPVAGRALAEHGADVLLITAPHLPSIPLLVMDTGRGKLSAQLELRRFKIPELRASGERIRADNDGSDARQSPSRWSIPYLLRRRR